ncbi:MAG: RNA pyrophosphohydrolase [Pseudomonadota bacterium]
MTPEEVAVLPYRPCVGIVVAREDGQVFAGERVDTPGAWQMPQGGIDPGESVVAAARRELQEETGIAPEKVAILTTLDAPVPYDLPLELIPKLWGGKYRGQMQDWVLMRFLGTDGDVDIAQEHAEFRDWQWTTPDALFDLIVPFKRDVYRHIFGQFASHLTGERRHP